MSSFLLGVLSSLVATGVLYLLRFNFSLVNFLFSKIYPDVSGEYSYYKFTKVLAEKKNSTGVKQLKKSGYVPMSLAKKESPEELLKILTNNGKDVSPATLKLKQFANRISGELYWINKGSIETISKITGKIISGRVLVLNWESTEKEHLNYGTYLLPLGNDLTLIKGTGSGLCVSCGDATSDEIILKKKS